MPSPEDPSTAPSPGTSLPDDAAPDAPLDAPLDTPVDAPLDDPLDAPLDAPVDAPLDAPVDAPLDDPLDAPLDTPFDAPLDDRALLAAHVAGDPDAFGELVRRHRDRLWAVALRTTSDPEEASDALQDAFISAYRNAASFRGESAVTTWLHRVVVNACLDRMRRRKVRPTVPLPEEDAESGGRGIADPRDDLDRLELRLEIDKALAALPVDQRAAIILVDVEGLSVLEAAAALGVPEGTVKSRCSRGRARLAVALAGLRNPDAGHGVPSTHGGEEPRTGAARRAPDPLEDRPGGDPL